MLHYDGGTGYGGGMDAKSEIHVAYLSDALKSYDIGAPRRLYPYVG